ncbi:MAG: sulfatase [Planctomycetota bacterium]
MLQNMRTSRGRTAVARAMAMALLLAVCLQTTLAAEAADSGKNQRPPRVNVLFIAIDDLRPELGCFGHKLVKSPNIDRLAAGGVRFERAYCQQAICGPSRASLMTGLRPDSVGVVHNETYFRDTRPEIVTLPEHFKNHGFDTLYQGKIYHGRFVDAERSWSRKPVAVKRLLPPDVGGYQLPESQALVRQRREEVQREFPGLPVGGLDCGPATEAADVPDEAYADGHTAAVAVRTLQELKDKPFFFGVGFLKPHLPFVAPKKYWDLYDPKDIELATNCFAPKNATSLGLHSSFELRTRVGIPKSGPIDDELARHLIHGYLACVSYVDAQVGKVLDELDRLGLAENTVVMLWGDHGWHLGQHGIWGKATNYEIATRAPLVVRAPWMSAKGASSRALVEFVDMYPTLCELAGVPLPAHLEGASFAPLLSEPDLPWKKAAFSQFPSPALREWAALPLSEPMRKTFFGPLIREAEARLEAESPARYNRERYENHVMGYTMRTDRHRLVRWVDLTHPDGEPIAVELYDHQIDPEENVNLANEPQYADVVASLTAQMKAGWRAALPEPHVR